MINTETCRRRPSARDWCVVCLLSFRTIIEDERPPCIRKSGVSFGSSGFKIMHAPLTGGGRRRLQDRTADERTNAGQTWDDGQQWTNGPRKRQIQLRSADSLTWLEFSLSRQTQGAINKCTAHSAQHRLETNSSFGGLFSQKLPCSAAYSSARLSTAFISCTIVIWSRWISFLNVLEFFYLTKSLFYWWWNLKKIHRQN